MKQIGSWPAALLRQWLSCCAVGAGCLLAGTAMFLRTGDRVMLMLTLLLALATAVRCTLLYRAYAGQCYTVTVGLCVGVFGRPAHRRLRLLCEDGQFCELSLDRRVRLSAGNRYRIYHFPSDSSGLPQILAWEELEYGTENSDACRN